MWSFGCILAELSTGRPIFPGYDENEMLELFNLMVGAIPEHMKKRGSKSKQMFLSDGKIKASKHSRVRKINPDEATIAHALPKNEDPDFLNFI